MNNVASQFDRDFSPNDFRLPANTKAAESQPAKVHRHKLKKKFLRGPVPWDWLSAAAAAQPRGKALHVALVIRFLDGFERTGVVVLSPARLWELKVSRHAGYRALAALQSAGLVAVERHQGRAPRVTIREIGEASTQ